MTSTLVSKVEDEDDDVVMEEEEDEEMEYEPDRLNEQLSVCPSLELPEHSLTVISARHAFNSEWTAPRR
jgi:hypothetical protein